MLDLSVKPRRRSRARTVSSCRSIALRNYRERHAVTRAELARWAEIDPLTLYRYETARSAVPRYIILLYRYYVRLFVRESSRKKEAVE